MIAVVGRIIKNIRGIGYDFYKPPGPLHIKHMTKKVFRSILLPTRLAGGRNAVAPAACERIKQLTLKAALALGINGGLL